jgi:hypothetical protein
VIVAETARGTVKVAEAKAEVVIAGVAAETVAIAVIALLVETVVLHAPHLDFKFR